MDEGNEIEIIEISQDNLVIRKGGIISLKSPWNTKASDCIFNLIKFMHHQYAVFIVTSPSKDE
jgi:hypothetical protein